VVEGFLLVSFPHKTARTASDSKLKEKIVGYYRLTRKYKFYMIKRPYTVPEGLSVLTV
jgi:hypothetical protein